MVLLKIKGSIYPFQYTAQIMDNHSCDGLLFCTLYTRNVLFSLFLYSDLTRILSSSYISSALPQLDLCACTGFPLVLRPPAEP
jgi:hypothetical protein